MEGQPAAAGWYADPHGSAKERYWDGERWTDNVRKSPVAATGPVAAMSTGEPSRYLIQAGAKRAR